MGKKRGTVMHGSRPTRFFVFELDSNNVQVRDEEGNVFIRHTSSYDDAEEMVRERLKRDLGKEYPHYKWILYPHSILQVVV